MKLKTTPLAALAALAMIGTASAVTTVTYSYYTATSSADTSWVSPTGSTSVTAVNFGGGETTFGGVTWLTGNPGNGSYNNASTIQMWNTAPYEAWANNASVFYSGGPNLLNDGSWSATQQNGVNFQIDLNGFTVGQAYLVQFVFADTRAIYGQTVAIDNYSTNISASADSVAQQFAYADGRFSVITASFTPGAGDTNFSFRALTDEGTGTQINGIQVLTIPEPSAAFLGGLGMLVLLRRRRA